MILFDLEVPDDRGKEFCEAIWHSAMSTAPAELIRLEKQAIGPR